MHAVLSSTSSEKAAAKANGMGFRGCGRREGEGAKDMTGVQAREGGIGVGLPEGSFKRYVIGRGCHPRKNIKLSFLELPHMALP